MDLRLYRLKYDTEEVFNFAREKVYLLSELFDGISGDKTLFHSLEHQRNPEKHALCFLHDERSNLGKILRVIHGFRVFIVRKNTLNKGCKIRPGQFVQAELWTGREALLEYRQLPTGHTP